MKILNSLDLTKNQLLNVRIQNLASAPGSPVEGQIYWNTTDKKLYVYNGSSWVNQTDAPAHANTHSAGQSDPITISNLAGQVADTQLPDKITAGTYTKLTVDAKGRATAGTTLTADDIPTLTASKISDFDTQVRTNRLDQMTAPTAAVSFNNQRITNLGTPIADGDAVTKSYADSLRAGLDVKQSVRLATTGNITLSGNQSIDGVMTVTGDRILVKDQTTASQNGIYVASTGAWSRATDADTNDKVTPGMFCYVEEGTVNADKQFVLTTNAPITLGTTALTFTMYGGGETITAGDGLEKVGSTLHARLLSTGGLEFSSNQFRIKLDGTSLTTSANGLKVTNPAGGKHAQDIGDGSAVNFTITHNLGTRDVTVRIYETASPYQEVYAVVEHATTNTVIVRFATAPTTNQYRVVVMA